MSLNVTKDEMKKLQKKSTKQAVLSEPKEQQPLLVQLIASLEKQEKRIAKLEKKLTGMETRMVNLAKDAKEARHISAVAVELTQKEK